MPAGIATRDVGGWMAWAEEQLATLNRRPRLPYTSLDGGTLSLRDAAGGLRGMVGMLDDGKIGVQAVNAPPPPTPSAPTVTGRFAGLTVAWDGTFADGSVAPSDWTRVEVHVGTAAGFTPSIVTLRGTFESPQGGKLEVAYAEATGYAKLVARNTSGAASTASAEVSGQPVKIAAPDLSPLSVLEAALADSAVSSRTIAAGAVVAGKVAARSITAAEIAAGTITANEIAAGAITTQLLAAGAVTATQIAAGTITATQIAAGAITTPLLAAGAITADKIAAGAVTATSLAADAITGKTITGGVFQTAVSGQRIVIDSVTEKDRVMMLGPIDVVDPNSPAMYGKFATPTNAPAGASPVTGVWLQGAMKGRASLARFDDFTSDGGVSDTFNRPDSATSLGTADTGQAWQVTNPATVYGISANTAYQVSDDTSVDPRAAIIYGTAPASFAQVSIAYPSTTLAQGLILRAVDSSNLLLVQINDTDLTLWKRDAGAWISLSPTTATATNANTTVVVRGEVTPAGVFTGYRNGVAVVSYTLTAAELTKFGAANATGVGFRSYPSPATGYDGRAAAAIAWAPNSQLVTGNMVSGGLTDLAGFQVSMNVGMTLWIDWLMADQTWVLGRDGNGAGWLGAGQLQLTGGSNQLSMYNSPQNASLVISVNTDTNMTATVNGGGTLMFVGGVRFGNTSGGTLGRITALKHGLINATTDANGDVLVAHGMPSAPNTVLVSPAALAGAGPWPVICTAVDYGATTFRVNFKYYNNTIPASTSVWFDYIAIST